MHRGQELAGIPAGPGGPLAAPLVDVAEFLQPPVALPAVGDDSRARLDMIGHERVQRDGRRVGQRPHPAPAKPRRFPDLHRDAGEHLLAPGPAAAQPRLLTADERLVHFHQPGQPVPPRAHQHRPQAMQHSPRGLVGTDLQRPFQAQRRDPVLAGGEEPAGGEPDRERRPRPVKDRARCHRGPAAALGTHVPTIGQPPARIATATRAGEASGPSQPLEVV